MTKKHTNHNRARAFGRADRRDIPLENDAMFSTVMQYEDACRGLIETIFEGRRERRLQYKDMPPASQKNIIFDPANKSIRLDVFFEDGDLPLGDGRCIMFLNTKGSIGELGADMDAFFEYLNGGVASIGTGKDSGSEFVEMVDNYVLDINGNEDWRQGYMKYELNLIEKYKEGMASGEARGISIGEARGVSIGEANERNRMVKEMNANGIPVSVIAKCASLDIKEVQRVINSK